MSIHLDKLLRTQSGKYIMSLLLGIGLASFFRFICKDKDCIVFAGPPIDDIKDKIYKNQDKCYTLVPTATKCAKNKKIVNFADSSAPV
jgi:hypothetical protein